MKNFSFDPPFREKINDVLGLMSNAWQDFFRLVSEVVWYNGSENIYILKNNISTPEQIVGLSFDKKFISASFVDYLIQRVTNSDEKIEVGTFLVAYNPDSDDWSIYNDPTTSGVTLSIDANGKIFYETTNQSGTLILSRLIVRAKSLKAKSFYSALGGKS